MMDDISIVADYCRNVLNLKEARLSDPYFYQSLSLCVIDAVFSIRAIYETTTMPTVKRYCDYFNLTRYRTDRTSLPKIEEQQSIKDLRSAMESKRIEFFTSGVFKNRQRTSPKNGILKSEAVFRFASELERYKVYYFQEMHNILANDRFEEAIKEIPGQRSGISLKYFFMLAGSDDLIKPDIHIMNFLKDAFRNKGIVRSISLKDAQVLLSGACDILRPEYPHLTPRLLDNTIWSYQSKRKQNKSLNHLKGRERLNQDMNPVQGMPNKGDILKGKVNDLCLYDVKGWRRRDIGSYKHDVNFNRKSTYPSRGDKIILIDTERHRYELNFSKPDYDHKICLGTPGRLKTWYQRKGFDEQRIVPDTWIFSCGPKRSPHGGAMREDDEIERIGMEAAMTHERNEGRGPEDVSAENLGFDIRSFDPQGGVRYIEVKARKARGSVSLTQNEWFNARRFQDDYYLYAVMNAAQTPELFIIQNPAQNLNPDEKIEVVRYVVPLAELTRKGMKVAH